MFGFGKNQISLEDVVAGMMGFAMDNAREQQDVSSLAGISIPEEVLRFERRCLYLFALYHSGLKNLDKKFWPKFLELWTLALAESANQGAIKIANRIDSYSDLVNAAPSEMDGVVVSLEFSRNCGKAVDDSLTMYAGEAHLAVMESQRRLFRRFKVVLE